MLGMVSPCIGLGPSREAVTRRWHRGNVIRRQDLPAEKFGLSLDLLTDLIGNAQVTRVVVVCLELGSWTWWFGVPADSFKPPDGVQPSRMLQGRPTDGRGRTRVRPTQGSPGNAQRGAGRPQYRVSLVKVKVD